MAASTKIWVNSVPPAENAADINGFKNENNNLIVGSGQILDTGDNQQTNKAVSHYAGVGDFYVDSGTSTAYVLSVTGAQIAPAAYATGMRFRFIAGTGSGNGAITINVAGLGVLNFIDDVDGGNIGNSLNGGIVTGELVTGYYDGANVRRVTVTRNLQLEKILDVTATNNAVNLLDDRPVTKALFTGVQTINSGANAVVAYNSILYDNRSEWTTGAAAGYVPFSSISAQHSYHGIVTFDSATFVAGDDIRLTVSGLEKTWVAHGGFTGIVAIDIAGMVAIGSSGTLQVTVFNNTSGTNLTLSPSTSKNYLIIAKEKWSTSAL